MTRRRIKIDEWPQSDRAAWDALLAPGSLLRPGGAFAALRPATVWSYEQCYGHWLSYCRRNGVDLEPLSPADRLTDARLLSWVEEMADLADTTRHTRLVGLMRVITCIAPDAARPLLRNLCRHAEWKARRQIRRRKIGRVLPTGDLLQAGLRHLDAVEGVSFRDAARFRDGLMVALLALVPMRIGNFRDLEIGRSFLIRESGFDLVLDASEAKGHRTIEVEVPEQLRAHMARYLTTFRPILIARADTPHPFLWANNWGRHYSYGNLGARISRLTKAMLGVDISPHLFRDAAATTIARTVPAQARAIAGVLGHSSLRTADRYYNQAKCLDASRSYTAIIEEELAAGSCRPHNNRNIDRRSP